MIHNPPYPQVRDEGVLLGRAPIIDFVGAGVTASIAANVVTVTIPGGGGGSLTITAFTATCPAGTMDQIFQIIDAAVGAASKVLLMSGHYTDTDENDPSDIDFRVTSVQVGSFFFRITSNGPEAVKGPFKFFYFLG